MGFDYFCFLSAIDWMPSPYGRGEDDPTEPPPERSTEIVQGYTGGETRFQVFARVTDIRRHVGVTLKADVPDDTDDASSRGSPSTPAPTGTSGRPTRCSASASPATPTCATCTCRRSSRATRCARTSRCWPGWSSRGPASSTSSRCRPRRPPADDDVAGELAPENPVPDQADAGLGAAPAEDAAAEAAVARSVEEAPDHEAPPRRRARPTDQRRRRRVESPTERGLRAAGNASRRPPVRTRRRADGRRRDVRGPVRGRRRTEQRPPRPPGRRTGTVHR